MATKKNKNCQACGKPITNPNNAKQNVHLIPGVRSECQKKRDSDYKKAQKLLGNIKYVRSPKGLNDRFNVQKTRECLKCSEPFLSQSLHNRMCETCKRHQPDIMSPSNLALETHNIDELFYFAWHY